MVDMLENLKPKQWLVMEVLAARYRLGEHLWPFPIELRPTLKQLEERGWIGFKSGHVENTYLAYLTEAGLKAWELIVDEKELTEMDEKGLFEIADTPCPNCGHHQILGIMLFTPTGVHQHTIYLCRHWGAGPDGKRCGWEGYTVPGYDS